MFIIGNLFIALGHIANFVISIYIFIIFVRVIISWVNPDPYNTIVQLLYTLTEPVLRPFRNIVPLGPIDVSPIFVFLLLYFLRSFVVSSLIQLGYRMGGSGVF